MEKHTFIQLEGYTRKANLQQDLECDECKKASAEQEDRLGIITDDCSDVCIDENSSISELENDIKNYSTNLFSVNIKEVHNFFSSPKGRLVLVHGPEYVGQLFSDTYEDFVKRITPHINLI